MQRETRTGCLAQRQSGSAVVDMVVRQDHPAQVGSGAAMLREVAQDRPIAAGVAGVDDGKAVVLFEQIRLGAADAGNAGNQVRSSVFPAG